MIKPDTTPDDEWRFEVEQQSPFERIFFWVVFALVCIISIAVVCGLAGYAYIRLAAS